MAFADEAGPTLTWLLDFCNRCWETKSIPLEWATSSVALIYKKGDPADCDNYRPICLISTAQKLFASMIKQRLVDAGAERTLWQSQFGFRTEHNAEDAIFIARRHVETAKAQRNGKLVLVALDWAKAFDSVNISSLLDALRRFGLPSSYLEMVQGMLASRRFLVEDCGACSDFRPQSSGISQGCTLSPFLFVMVMTVLMHDAVGLLGDAAALARGRGDLADLVYADDTLLFGVLDQHVNEFMHAVHRAGKKYGMELHWDKFQVMCVNCEQRLRRPDGTALQTHERMSYLGATVSQYVHDQHELVRRIALSKRDFLALSAVWRRSALTQTRKLALYVALVESRLLYGLSSLCLTVAQKRKLDGFQSRCLRSIFGIKPAFISRISNAHVLERSGHRAASTLLQERQLILLGRVLRAPEGHPLRSAAIAPGTQSRPATDRFVRRVGRPSKEWISDNCTNAIRIFGTMEKAQDAAMCEATWRARVKSEPV